MSAVRPAPPAVIFDLDGTLVDSEPFWAAGFSTGLAHVLHRRGHGSHSLDAADMARFRGGRVPDTIGQIVDWLGLSETVHGAELGEVSNEVIAWVTREFAADPRPIPEAVQTARKLADAGVPLALASSSARGFIDTALAAIGLGDLFPVRVSAVGIPRGKPDPLVYSLALRDLHLPGARAVAIEDSPVGVAAALNAGMACVWFLPESDPGEPDLDKVQGLLTTEGADRLPSRVRPTRHLSSTLVMGVLQVIAQKESRA